MPFVELKPDKETEAPRDPHFALLVGDGEAIAIPRGAHLLMVDDPTGKKHKPMPLLLHTVSFKKIVFVCGCGRPGCTRVYEYQLVRGMGRHPDQNQGLSEAHDKNKLKR